MNKRQLCWKDIDRCCHTVAEQILNSTLQPSSSTKIDAIIGLSRGGLIPATMLAHLLNIREVLVHGYHSYDDTNNKRDLENIHGVMYQDVVSVLQRGLHGKQILVVDDLCDEGITLHGLMKRLRNKFNIGVVQFYSAVLYCKDHSVFQPDFVGEHCDNDWLEFPWEQHK